MTITSAVEKVAAPAALDRHVAAMVGDEPTINDVASVLHLLGQSDDVDGVRIQALCHLAARALGKFSADVRWAPATALNDFVAAGAADCRSPLCDRQVLPWTEECCGCCSESCCGEVQRGLL